MKKVILLLFSIIILVGCASTSEISTVPKNKWYDCDSRIEIVNEKTIIFKDVVKIEIRTNDKNQITYVYDLSKSRLVKVARGSFDVGLSRSDYLIQSDKRITKTIYDVIIE